MFLAFTSFKLIRLGSLQRLAAGAVLTVLVSIVKAPLRLAWSCEAEVTLVEIRGRITEDPPLRGIEGGC